eukprot:8794403-Pyramimonas_sp.AAC.1
MCFFLGLVVDGRVGGSFLPAARVKDRWFEILALYCEVTKVDTDHTAVDMFAMCKTCERKGGLPNGRGRKGRGAVRLKQTAAKPPAPPVRIIIIPSRRPGCE